MTQETESPFRVGDKIDCQGDSGIVIKASETAMVVCFLVDQSFYEFDLSDVPDVSVTARALYADPSVTDAIPVSRAALREAYLGFFNGCADCADAALSRLEGKGGAQ